MWIYQKNYCRFHSITNHPVYTGEGAWGNEDIRYVISGYNVEQLETVLGNRLNVLILLIQGQRGYAHILFRKGCFPSWIIRNIFCRKPQSRFSLWILSRVAYIVKVCLYQISSTISKYFFDVALIAKLRTISTFQN